MVPTFRKARNVGHPQLVRPALRKTRKSGPRLVATPGRFGPWGGRYVPETLMAALDELEREYEKAQTRSEFQGATERAAEDVCGQADAFVLCPAADVKNLAARKFI